MIRRSKKQQIDPLLVEGFYLTDRICTDYEHIIPVFVNIKYKHLVPGDEINFGHDIAIYMGVTRRNKTYKPCFQIQNADPSLIFLTADSVIDTARIVTESRRFPNRTMLMDHTSLIKEIDG